MHFSFRTFILAFVATAASMLACNKGSTRTTTTVTSATAAASTAIIAASATAAPSASVVASASASAETLAAPTPPTAKDVAAFLVDVDHALKTKDAAFFETHVSFPITIQYYNYDMEGRIKPETFKTAADLLKKRGDWDMPKGFVAALAKPDLSVGDPDCNQTADEKMINYRKGPHAIQIKDNDVTVTYLRAACSAEGHSEIYKLRADATAGLVFVKMTAKE